MSSAPQSGSKKRARPSRSLPVVLFKDFPEPSPVKDFEKSVLFSRLEEPEQHRVREHILEMFKGALQPLLQPHLGPNSAGVTVRPRVNNMNRIDEDGSFNLDLRVSTTEGLSFDVHGLFSSPASRWMPASTIDGEYDIDFDLVHGQYVLEQLTSNGSRVYSRCVLNFTLSIDGTVTLATLDGQPLQGTDCDLEPLEDLFATAARAALVTAVMYSTSEHEEMLRFIRQDLAVKRSMMDYYAKHYYWARGD